MEVSVKFENAFTGSIKEQGAQRLLTPAGAGSPRGRGDVGGQSCAGRAYHANRLGIAATIVMPEARRSPRSRPRLTGPVRFSGETVLRRRGGRAGGREVRRSFTHTTTPMSSPVKARRARGARCRPGIGAVVVRLGAGSDRRHRPRSGGGPGVLVIGVTRVPNFARAFRATPGTPTARAGSRSPMGRETARCAGSGVGGEHRGRRRDSDGSVDRTGDLPLS